ncbi:MAG: host attachment protein, partial [Pseudomonadota bacterium]|nr:host attachment protein [Desulfobacterales bacterium]
MSDYLIVVVNRACARFFTLEPVEFPEIESGPRIVTLAELENPEIKDAQKMYSDPRTGSRAAPLGGSVHGYEDKRDQHLDELRRRFAVRVLQHLRKLAGDGQVRTVILAASARMRRFLYPDLDPLSRQGYRVHKLSKNMINFSPQKIHEYLAEDGLVPRRKRA